MKPRIYLETTLFNYYFLIDPIRTEDIEATKLLFSQIKQGFFAAYISDLTISELQKCSKTHLRKDMLKLITNYEIEFILLEGFSKCESLADKYIKAGAIPIQKKNDALHIAWATLGAMDILVSWNQEHIVRYHTQTIVKTINSLEGLSEMTINTPKEVVIYGKE